MTVCVIPQASVCGRAHARTAEAICFGRSDDHKTITVAAQRSIAQDAATWNVCKQQVGW